MPYFPCFRERGEKVVGPSVSTGLACASSPEEALLKGLYESVERDAFVITWYNRLAVPQVEIESYSKLCDLYEKRLKRDGLRYFLFDTTTDISLPSFLCLLIDERRNPPMISAGGATSLDPVQSASKALMEAVQTREWAKFLGSGGKVFHFGADFRDIRDFEDHVALYAYGDMLHAVEFLLRSPTSLERIWKNGATGDASADLAKATNILRERGLDAIAIDLTTPDVADCGLFVTRVLAPSLQPLDADYLHRFLGGCRLYQVPRLMGYRSSDSSVELLNPYPHPYP
jgi:ribosomal protein S12 methylthiotransferase accessory factor